MDKLEPIGPFQPLRLVGDGQFGKTFMALDASGRRVALKTRWGQSRFVEHEFLLTRSLPGHPNLAIPTELLELSGHGAVLVRDWIDGDSLDQLIRDRAFCLADVLDIVESVARGLNTLHRAGILHCDLKPSNIVVPRDNSGNLDFQATRIIDYGLARAAALEMEQFDILATSPGLIIGTPLYIAPEQLTSTTSRDLSAAADIYTVGILFFELVYGYVPYATAESIFETFHYILAKDVDIPAKPAVPNSLRSLLKECIRKKPDERLSTAGDLLRRLKDIRRDAALAGRLAISLVTQDEAVAQLARRKKILAVGASGGTVAVLLAALVVSGLTSQAVWGAVAMMVGGIVVAAALRAWIRRRRRLADVTATTLFGLRDRRELTRSICIQTEELAARCEEFDQQYLGTAIALLIQEYRDATASGDRQAALLNAMKVFETLLGRLSPWYIRHERLLTVLVSLLGILPGVASLVFTLLHNP